MSLLAKIKSLFKRPISTDLHTRVKLILAWSIVFLLTLSAFRVLIYLVYKPVFTILTPFQLLVGFLQGIRFDISISCLLLFPVFIVLLFPSKSKRFVCWVHYFLSLFYMVCLGILVGDFIYFPEAKRHLTEEIVHAGNEIQFLINFTLEKYWFVLVGLVLIWGVICLIGRLVINKQFKIQKQSVLKYGLLLLLTVAVLFVGIRGHIGRGKPLSIRSLNMYSSNTAQAVLMMNGLFSVYHSLRKHKMTADNPMPIADALQYSQQLLKSPLENEVNQEHPLARKVALTTTSKIKNVFVVLLESWTPKYIDSYAHGNFGVTPNFDRLVENGIQFTQGYAVGVRSIFGLTATFAGIPLVPGIPYFSDGLELNDTTSMASILRKKGYYTAFIQSSLRSSYQMCNMATHIFNFEESYGMEDLPKLLDYQKEQDFGYDYDLLDYAASKASQALKANKPFFIFTFTGTTHTPFTETLPKFNKYPSTTVENKYLNTLYYADYAIGNLMKKAKEEGWMDNTLFVFMADHTMGLAQKDDEIHQKFRIPYVLYAPKILQPTQINYPVSQLDLIPTLMHLLGLQEPFTALGNNALDAQVPHFAFITEGNNIALITPNGFIRHDRTSVLESSAEKSSPTYKELEQKVLALDKSVTELIGANRWAVTQQE